MIEALEEAVDDITTKEAVEETSWVAAKGITIAARKQTQAVAETVEATKVKQHKEWSKK